MPILSRLRRSILPTLGLTLLAASCASTPASSAQAGYDRLADDFLRAYYERHPVRATQLGVHEHDAALPDWTRPAVAARVQELRRFEERLRALDPSALDADSRVDLRILEHRIGAELLELEQVRGWRRDPRHYGSIVTGAVASLGERTFAPLPERLASMTARLERVPAMLALARTNLEDVPALWVELALRDTRGAVSFLNENLPAMLAEQGFADVAGDARRAFEQARAIAVASVEGYRRWLEEDLAPRANGDFRLGEELFLEKVRLEEFVDATADELWDWNERAIERYTEWVTAVAAEIDPTRSVGDVMAEMTADYPPAEELVETARRMVVDSRDFIVANDIVTLPSDRLPLVRPTPEYARMGFASMSTPGPFETVATEAFYNITNVDPEWSAEQQHQHLTYFNRPGLLGITVHEAMPGHFVQLLYEQEIPTALRRVFTPGSLVEGWAHYTEQMMIDEGLGGGDPWLRLGQLRRALQRHARWYAGMALHVRGASIEEAAERFAEIAFFAPFPALRETQRGTYNPTYLYYALGRIQILELREELEDAATARGEEFSLRAFHDEFLRLGLPVPLARKVMLP